MSKSEVNIKLMASNCYKAGFLFMNIDGKTADSLFYVVSEYDVVCFQDSYCIESFFVNASPSFLVVYQLLYRIYETTDSTDRSSAILHTMLIFDFDLLFCEIFKFAHL